MRLARLLHRLGRFRRHVVLVVLGEHLGRGEHAVGAELALRDDAFALLEQVRKDAGVAHRDAFRGVGDDEADRQAVGGALDAAGFHQAAEAEGAPQRCLVLGNLAGAEEEHQVRAEGVQHQRCRHGERRDADHHCDEPLVARFHAAPPALRASRRARCRSAISSITTHNRPAPYEPQTNRP